MKIKLINSAFTPSFSQSQVIINKINQTKGLSDERASSIVKEKNGFVWIGTENGLNRYDGNKIKIYNKQNSALSSNDIADLLIDRKEKIWIVTFGGGLNLYSPSNAKFIVSKNILRDAKSIPFNELNTIFEDSKGTIWIGTKNGLSSFVKKDQAFRTNDKASGNSSPAETVVMAVRAQKMGMRIMIDFHYSDTWADPGKQAKPAAWAHHSFTELQNNVYIST